MENDKLNSEGMSFKYLLKKLDNFWYHYKIQTIIALVLIATFTVCITQMLTREKYDYCVLYAGPYPAMMKSFIMKDAFESVGADRDKNGNVAVAIDDIVILSPEEQQAANENGASFNAAFAQQSMTEYYQQIMGGEAVICMLSPYMYQFANESDRFMPLDEVFEVVPESAYDKCSVLLSKTEFGQYFDGINDLPDDTLICVLRFSQLERLFKGTAKAQEIYNANLDFFRAIVNFEAPLTVTDIIDRTKTEDLVTAEALEGFYTDEEYDYYFSSIKSQYIDVYYSDGTSENIKDAIAAGRVTIADLDKFDIGYYKDPKGEN